MSDLEFIASLINTLAWPVVVLIIVFLLKKPLSKLLQGLTRLKYNELEMDFEKELSKLEKTIDHQNKDNKSSNIPTDSLVDKKMKNEILSIAEIHPSAAITVAWAMVEKEIANTTSRLSISSEYPSYNSAMKNTDLLKEQKYIDTATYELINEFRRLRNSVAHALNDGDKITYLEAVKYYELANKLTESLKLIERK